MPEEMPNGQDAEGSYIAQAEDGSTATITVVPKDRSTLVIAFFALIAILALIAGLVVVVIITRDRPMAGETPLVGTATPMPTLHPTASPTTPNGTPTSPVTPHPTTASPTATVTNTPKPSPTLTPSCPAVNGPFATVWSIIQGEIGCATGSHFSTWVAEEAFENGWMFWRKDNEEIYAVYSLGSWETYTHTWHEGAPYFACSDANTPDQSPPTPVMGFGQVWCTYPKVRQNLGWATEAEHGCDAIVQHFERGFVLRTDNGIDFVFYSDGHWEQR